MLTIAVTLNTIAIIGLCFIVRDQHKELESTRKGFNHMSIRINDNAMEQSKQNEHGGTWK